MQHSIQEPFSVAPSHFTALRYEVRERVAYITLSRPEKRNALTPTLIAELRQAFAHANSDDAVRLVMLQADGKAFCAGLDLEELAKITEKSAMDNLYDSEAIAALFRDIYTHRKLIISKVQGAAFAGGCGLACAADIVIADKDNAKFSYSEAKIGFVPAIVAVLILRRSRHAGIREMLLRANVLSADEALRLGLINYSVPSAELDATAEALAREICTSVSPTSTALTKRLLWSIETMDFEDALNLASALNAFSRKTADLERGIQLFLRKETLKW
ncbi:MAG: enoyl-CoA hydratase-related protein [Chloroherpetonaceae bacterium]|nr:enoyl-CoA hydratase-related protein [Chloroherpetonaceae bacterium]MCS7212256.1 enoyl-CoA hydratase-related protein [Chloroherpetonaceae bacterium]MDW8018825.1 enoyl-CoA hydratase-related protein [Chloroherpetonaceae bacterium]MDW8467267.1 enoyl-CoA hydratase-related protein [Chloroherpetonaceae bacterium]